MNRLRFTPQILGAALVVVAVAAALAAYVLLPRLARRDEAARQPEPTQRAGAPTGAPVTSSAAATPATPMPPTTLPPVAAPPTTAPIAPTPPAPSPAVPVAAAATPAVSTPAAPVPAQPGPTAPPSSPVPTTAPVAAATPAAGAPASPTPGWVAKGPPVPAGLSEQDSRAFPKQEYFLYVPKRYDGRTQYRLLVMIHGNGRHVEDYTEEFKRFAEERRYIVLSPFFPEDVRFQQLGIGEEEKTIRSDQRVLGLVDEVGGRVNVETAKFDLFGFSAGGQFAHRFLYLYPERLRTVVVAAPGTVTMPNEKYRWPSGLRNLDCLAGVRVNLDRVRQVRIMLTVGREDTGDESVRDTDEANRFGKTRLARARTLHDEWEDAKIGHRYVEVKDLEHDLDERIVGPATRFIAEG